MKTILLIGLAIVLVILVLAIASVISLSQTLLFLDNSR